VQLAGLLRPLYGWRRPASAAVRHDCTAAPVMPVQGDLLLPSPILRLSFHRKGPDGLRIAVSQNVALRREKLQTRQSSFIISSLTARNPVAHSGQVVEPYVVIERHDAVVDQLRVSHTRILRNALIGMIGVYVNQIE
jgi:hypothetical protein